MSKLGMANQYRKKFNKCVDDIYEYLNYFNSNSATRPGAFDSYFNKIDEIKFKLDICENVKDYNKIVSLEALENESAIWDKP